MPFPRRLAAALFAACLTAGVAPADPAAPPEPLPASEQTAWPAIGRVTLGRIDAAKPCTGTLVASDLVLTAAHCVFSNREGRLVAPYRIHFTASGHADRHLPHRIGVEVWRPEGASGPPRGGDPGDIALIRLASPLPPDIARPMPLIAPEQAKPPYRVIGYRHDLPGPLTGHAACAPVPRNAPGTLGLDCAVVGGNSGAPVLSLVDGAWRVVASVSARVGGHALRAIAVIPQGTFAARAGAPQPQ